MSGASEAPRGRAEVDELPGFRYQLPETPVATASADIGHVAVRVELHLSGELDITTTPRRVPAETDALRACTLRALRAMCRGLMVTGLGSYTPAIGSAAGNRFAQTGYQFHAPNTMAFAGRCSVGFAQNCECGMVTVTGEVQYSLDVTAMPHNGRMSEDDGAAKQNAWFLRYEQELASIGMLVLAGVPIAPGRLVGAGGRNGQVPASTSPENDSPIP
ncbi:hypothetical protein [Actinophytocola sp.]|uniref:hypothetical protein n=1 Tax=Actinophytocola sp. TaxID=1872138 RepID=UPI002D7FA015|nr:hypothetical protein [Actinophytocola sp.]HET9141331.1 hypothetical protein [Actinophytocola sp.]